MARPINPDVEQKLLVCALQTKNARIRAEILSETDEEDYGTEEGKLIRRRINVLLSLGKALGNAVDFSEDPALTSAAATIIKATAIKRKAATKFNLGQVQKFIDQLKMHRNLRSIYEAQQRINDLAGGEVDEEGIQEIGTIMEETLLSVRQGFDKQPLFHLGSRQSDEGAKKELRDLLEFKPEQFISTGLDALDRAIYGWERGNLVTISAPRGGGKTAMAVVMAVNQYLSFNHNVCIVSLEMHRKDLMRRVLSNISSVPHDEIRYSKNLDETSRRKVGRAYREFHRHGSRNDCCFTIWPVKDSFFTPQKLESNLAPFMYDVIIIDYLTKFYAGKMDVWKMQMEYSNYLSMMAKRLDCVVIVLTQLSEEERVKYGRAVEENTDYWLWWPWKETEEEETGEVEIRLAKARHAAKRRISANFLFDIMRIETVSTLKATATQKQKGDGTQKGRVSDEVWSSGGY